MIRISHHENGNSPAVPAFIEVDPEDGSPHAACRQVRLIAGISVGVAGRIEEERSESRARQELRVLRTLERGCTRRLGCCVRVERRRAVYGLCRAL